MPSMFVVKWAALLIDIIEKLLKKDPTRRLGHAYSAKEIKEHEFFRGVAGDLFIEGAQPPFIPARGNKHTREAHCTSTTTIYRRSRVPSSSHRRVLRALLWPNAVTRCREVPPLVGGCGGNAMVGTVLVRCWHGVGQVFGEREGGGGGEEVG